MRTAITVAAACSALLVAGAAAALTAGEKCEADKLKTAGKYAFCRLNADSKGIKKGLPPDYGKCDEKYGAKWALVESKAGGSCPVSGDLGDIQTQASSAAGDLAATIGGDPPVGCIGDLLTCEADLAVAELCGNGAIDAGEDCDLGTLDGATCVTEGFAGGVLSCLNGCAFDTSACWAARFEDNADGTITDNASGLMWEKKTERNSVPSLVNPHDADNFYRWSGTCTIDTGKLCQPTSDAAALCAANAEGGTTGCDECTGGDGTCDQPTTIWTWAADLNTASFAGATDWRIPTRQELEGIFDLTDTTPPVIDVAFHGASCGVFCTDPTSAACSCTSPANWSATTYAPDPANAWTASFNDGGVVGNFRATGFWVRAVRDGS